MNSEQKEEQQTDVGKVSLGERLRSAREEKGLSLQEVADSLRLRVSVIEEIEEDQLNVSQIPTYTRGYIRGYAKYLGINVEYLLKENDMLPSEHQNVQMQSFSRKTRHQRNDHRLMTLTWAILSIAVGITIIWGWQSGQDESINEIQNTEHLAMFVPTKEATETKTSLSDEQTIDAVALEKNTEAATAQSSAPEVAEVSSQAEISVETPAVENVNNSESLEPVITSTLLAMNFIADCWVDIRDGNGKRLLTGIKSRGESIELSGKEPFKIVLGAPSAVELSYKGKKIDLSDYPPKRVARLTLPQK